MKNLKRNSYCFLAFIFHLIFQACPFNYIRIIFLRLAGAKVGKSNYISCKVRFDFPWRLSIGNNNFIGSNVYLDCRGGTISIGSNNDISENVKIYTLSHSVKSENFGLIKKNIIIMDNSWICVNTVLLPNAFISTGSVIGAGVVINFKTEEYSKYQYVANVSPLEITNVYKKRND